MRGLSAPYPTVRRPVARALYIVAMLLFCVTVSLADPREDTARGIEAHKANSFVDAMRWYRQAAEQGYAPAQARLAYLLDRAEENEEAAQWYRKAAEQGNSDGQFGLGQMYAKGEGVERDLEQARHWTTQAAEQGVVTPMRVLALAYEQGGLGLSVDQQKALAWLERAAERGDRWSIDRLIQVYRGGQLGMAVDLEKAKSWETHLAEKPAKAEKMNVERLFQ